MAELQNTLNENSSKWISASSYVLRSLRKEGYNQVEIDHFVSVFSFI